MRHLLILLVVLLVVGGCRTLKKSMTSATSEQNITEEEKSAWEKETVTEYQTEYITDTIYTALPGDTVFVRTTKVITAPKYYKQTIKEKGNSDKKKAEAKSEEIVEKHKDAEIPLLLRIALFVIAFGILLIGIAATIFSIRKK